MPTPRPLSPEQLTTAVAYGRPRLTRAPVAPNKQLLPGGRVWFAGDEGGWDVRAAGGRGRWVICTQPVSGAGGVRYTVIDFGSGVRGPDNFHGLGYESLEQIHDALAMFESGDAEVSVRHDVYLEIAHVEPPPPTPTE